MIFSRFGQQLKEHHWLASSVDFLIVVLGVFIGLQVNNWNEARQDRATEVVYLRALVNDFDSIEAAVQAQIDFELQAAHYINQSLDLIDKPPSIDKRMRLGMLLGQLVARRTLKIESPTFQELQSGGKLNLIRDPALRSKIVSYFFLIKRWQDGLDQNNEVFVDKGFDVFLRDSGIVETVWNQATMHESPMFGSTIGQNYNRLMHQQYDDRILIGKNAVLDSPSGAPFWDRLRQQLSWRAMASGHNESIALRLKRMTADIKAETLAYLKER